MAAGVFCFLAGWNVAAEDMAKNQVERELTAKISREVKLKYLLFRPSNYKTEEKWPLILFLHGAGERGSNLGKVAVHGPPRLVKEWKDFPFVVVSPQCPAGQTWDDEALLALLDEVMEEEKVDPTRVYLTGLSMGGYGTWSLGLKHPERFAAIAPICGGGSNLPILLPKGNRQAALKRLPVWAFHGGKDEVVPVSESERMVNALKSIGNEAKLTLYPEAGHDSWTETYANQELYDWFLKHRSKGKRGREG